MAIISYDEVDKAHFEKSYNEDFYYRPSGQKVFIEKSTLNVEQKL